MIVFLNKNKNFFSILFLVFFAVLTHINSFSFVNVIDFGDQVYTHRESYLELYKTWNTWRSDSNFGLPNVQIYMYPIYLISSFLAHLNFTSGFIFNITFLIPIAIFGFISPYLFSMKLTRNNFISITTALFYGTTVDFLIRQNSHAPIAFVEALAPLVFLLFMLALEKNTIRHWVSFSLFYSLSIFYEVRITYVLTLVLIIYYLFFYLKYFKRNIKNIILCAVTIILINIFWLLPIITGSATSQLDQLVNRSLENNNQYNILQSFNVYNYIWKEHTGDSLADSFFIWAIPIISFFVLFTMKDSVLKQRSKVIFFAIITLLGIIITKQASEPFSNLFTWLRDNIPGFVMFRSAYKLYFITSIGYLGLISFSLLKLQKERKTFLFLFFAFSISFISLINTMPVIQQKLEMNKVKTVQSDYLKFKEIIISEDSFFRTMEVPKKFKWMIRSSEHPNVSIENVLNPKIFSLYELETPTNDRNKKVIDFFNQNYADSFFDLTSIKYVTIPPRDFQYNRDLWEIFYGEQRSYYIEELDKLPYLKRLELGMDELVVYENTEFRSHIFSLEKLFKLNSLSNLDSKSNFVKNELDSYFYFVDQRSSEDTEIKATNLTSVFEKAVPNINYNNNLHQIYENTNRGTASLFVNTGQNDFFVEIINNQIEIYSKSNDIISIDEVISTILPTEKKLIKEIDIELNSEKIYFIAFNDLFTQLTDGIPIRLSNKSGVLKIYSSSIDVMPNGSFETGLWTEKVEDCSAYDENAKIGQSLDNSKKTDGYYSLRLEATNHIACTKTNVKLEGGDYLFSFNFQSENTKNAGYYIKLNNAEEDVIKDSLIIENHYWNNIEKKFNIPNDVSALELYIYAYPLNGVNNNIVRYDNFSIKKLEELFKIDISEKKDNFKNIPFLSGNEHISFLYSNSNFNFSNVIINGSFEEGLWSDEVGDCNNYDFNPQISMQLNQLDSSTGSTSLQLEATRHTACTKKTIPINGGSTYLLKFDYKGINSNYAGYYIIFNNNENTVISEKIDLEKKTTDWNSFEKTIYSPNGANKLTLYVYAFEPEDAENSVILYDNFSLQELPDIQNRYYIVSDPQTNFVEPQEITFDLVNPTKKLVHIKGASTPFYLAMSESYHPQWQAQLANSKIGISPSPSIFRRLSLLNIQSWIPWVTPDRIPDDYHFELNGFLNGWYVDTQALCHGVESNDSELGTRNKELRSGCTLNADGSYDIELVLEFFPQRWFYLGLLISTTTLLGCIGYLGYDFVQRRRGKLKVKKLVTSKASDE